MGAAKSRPPTQVISAERAVELHGPASAAGRHITTRCIRSDYDIANTVLGTGFNGAVVLAIGKHDARKYAVKSFDKRGFSASDTEQLKNEVEIHLSLDHPHIVRLEHVYETNEELHCVMECMNGGELFDRVIAAKRFPPERAAGACRQILLAVAYMHAQGVVHRDIKPENLMYESSDSEHLKLIDFGFAAYCDDRCRLRGTLGTAQYSAPEVAEGRYTNKVDLWSVGVVSYVMLTGSFPTNQGKQRLQSANPDAHAFVSSLMNRDADSRLTASAALNHPWICKYNRRLPMVDSSILLTLHNFPHVSPFRHTCLLLAAWSLPVKEQGDLRRQFEAIDEDHNGTIELEEFCHAFSNRLGIDCSSAESVFRLLDTNSDNKLGYSEFVAAALVDKQRLSEDAMHEAFRRFDRDGSGEITADEIVTVLGKPADCDANTIVSEADYDGNGSISFEEFRRYLKDSVRTIDERAGGCSFSI